MMNPEESPAITMADSPIEPPPRLVSETETAPLILAESDRIPNLEAEAVVVAVPVQTALPSVHGVTLPDANPETILDGAALATDDDSAVLASELASLPNEPDSPTGLAPTRRGGPTWLSRLFGRRKPRLPAHLRRPRRSPGEVLYAFADNILARLNAPLAARDPLVRALVGWTATATLVTCLVANFVLPHVIRPRTALTFLQEKVIALQVGPKTAQAAPSHGGH